MNIHFAQVEEKFQVVPYLLAAFAMFTVVMLTLSLSRQIELDLSVPSLSVQAAQIHNNDLPVAIPAPRPPAGQAQTIATPKPAGTVPSNLAPQVVAAPMPSVP